jgi:hypothetical protein
MIQRTLRAMCVVFGLLAGCAGSSRFVMTPPPALGQMCLEAQRFVVQTEKPVNLVLETSFDSFVKSKAAIEGPRVHQYIWYEQDDREKPMMVSCKLKSADHLNAAFGPGTAGPEKPCQSLNRLTYQRVRASLGGRVPRVEFDAAETVVNRENPGMTGPDWLAPYTMTYLDESGILHIRSKGFRVDWTDPRYAQMPARFRGVQYCHFIAPDYLRRLLTGAATPGASVGRLVPAAPPPDVPVPPPAS